MGNAGSETGVFAPWRDEAEEPYIRFENVTKRYGNVVAIDNLSLDIYQHEFFVLLGSSGCGNTTLLRLLSGLEKPTKGRVIIGGRDVSGLPPHLRPVNTMFQPYALFPHLSVRENIAFGLRQAGRPRRIIKPRVAELLELLQLKALASRKPHQLSADQQQRVALARAIANKPRVLLLDEPLGRQDKKLSRQAQFELINLQKGSGITFVMIASDQEEAMTVSSRVAVIDKGKVLQVDVPEKIYEQPLTRSVASMMGDMNSFECNVLNVGVQNPSGRALTVTSTSSTGRIVLWDNYASRGLLPKDNVWLGLRPEKIAVSKEKPQPQQQPLNMVQGEVVDITYSGNMSTYHVQLDDESVIRAQITNRQRSLDRAIARNERVWLSWSIAASMILQD